MRRGRHARRRRRRGRGLKMFAFFLFFLLSLCVLRTFCASPRNNSACLRFLRSIFNNHRHFAHTNLESFSPRLWFEKKLFPCDPRKHVGNCGRFGPLPGTAVQILRWPARGHFGTIFAKLRTTGSGHAAATRRGRRARRRRRRGRARAALRVAGCQRVRCFCGGCRASARRPARPCRCATHGRAGQPQAACNMHVRVPAAARARVRAVRPRARASARHTHVSPTILSVLPADSRPGVCARGRQPIACSLSHTLTVACVASYMPVTWALGRSADGLRMLVRAVEDLVRNSISLLRCANQCTHHIMKPRRAPRHVEVEVLAAEQPHPVCLRTARDPLATSTEPPRGRAPPALRQPMHAPHHETVARPASRRGRGAGR